MDDPHSQKISAERAIMELTGASRSQIRAAALGAPLRDAVTNFQQRNGGSTVAQPPQVPRIETVDQAFALKPFRLEEGHSSGNNSPANAPAASGEFHVFIINNNGIAEYWAINAYFLATV